VKGFIQTHLSHTRHPVNTLRQLGLWGFFGFYMSVGASAFMMLVNIIYWMAGGFYLLLFLDALSSGLTPWEIIAGPHNFNDYHGLSVFGMRLEPWPLFYWGETESRFWSVLSVIFFVTTILLVLANFLFMGVHILACIKRRYYHLLPAALLMPFYWEKTIHGLDSGTQAAQTSMFENVPSGIKILTVQPTTAQTAEENKIS